MLERIKRLGEMVLDAGRAKVLAKMDRRISDHHLTDGIEVVVVVSASKKRRAEFDAAQKALDMEREGVVFERPDFERRQQELDKRRREQLEKDDALFRQYGQLRKNFKAEDDPDYPLTIVGDDEASFMLAIKNGTVLGGLRLNEVLAAKVPPASGEIAEEDRPSPVDKVVEARLENIFKEKNGVTFNRAEYNILNVDGAFVSDELGALNNGTVEQPVTLKTAVLFKLLESIATYAGSPGPTDGINPREDVKTGYNPHSCYDMSYFMPATVFAAPIEYFYTHHKEVLQGKNALFTHLTNGTYINRAGDKKTRPIYGIILNDKLKKLIPDEAKKLADHTDPERAALLARYAPSRNGSAVARVSA